MYLHSPLPAPNDEAAASLKLMGEIWSLEGPLHARVYACPDSSQLVFKVFTWSDDDTLVCNWYIQPNIQIRDSLAYIFNVEANAIVPLDVSIMKEFATHCSIESDPLCDRARFLDFTWHSYTILDFVVQAIITLS